LTWRSHRFEYEPDGRTVTVTHRGDGTVAVRLSDVDVENVSSIVWAVTGTDESGARITTRVRQRCTCTGSSVRSTMADDVPAQPVATPGP
jgi:hypothetical protein